MNPALAQADSPPPVTFQRASLALSDPRSTHTIAFLRRLTLEKDGALGLLSCDMHSGDVRWTSSISGGSRTQVLARLANPCRAEQCDLDGDGLLDLVVADLGSFLPADHVRGRVVWLRRGADGSYHAQTIAASLGRVADVRPADFDGDGDQDLVVAEFGWHTTGGIHWLENRGGRFHAVLLDPRSGGIHVPVCDLNEDGRPDFVALISQEHETIVAFLNQGSGEFQQKTLWSALDPGFGGSGLETVDLDRDGDLDMLFTSGDTFDSRRLKPSHGVHWLENRGGLKFEYRRLADLPGAYRALPGDFDGDGDLDVVASSFFDPFVAASIDREAVDSVLVLEQFQPRAFRRYRLERGRPAHVALETGDFDGDGDLDFAASVQLFGKEPSAHVAIWLNQRKPEG
jgi:hypothetical protein